MSAGDDRSVACGSCSLGAACLGHACVFTRAIRPQGETLFRQGDTPDAVHFLRRGRVLLTEIDGEGRVVDQLLRPAGSLLESLALSRRPHRRTAIAVDEVEVCTLALASLEGWLGPARSPARALLELCLRETAQAGADRGRTRGPAAARVAAFLLEHGDDSAPLQLQLQLVAGLLSMRPETLSRVLARFREAGAIAGRGSLRILDRSRLEEAAGSDR
ncbi:MAG TPA: Crp/Fnr family transcriptional regulator [Myxococcales bacterium]|nr:Crp/Fnr family transcriptional regulator [Myxococcales bacterium]